MNKYVSYIRCLEKLHKRVLALRTKLSHCEKPAKQAVLSITPKIFSRNLSNSVILRSIFITSHNLDSAIFKKHYMSNTVLKIFSPVCLAGKERCVRGWRGAAVVFEHSRDRTPVLKFFVARDIVL